MGCGALRWAMLIVLATLFLASAFPTYASANGTVELSSAFGGDVVLAPDAGGACVAETSAGGLALTSFSL